MGFMNRLKSLFGGRKAASQAGFTAVKSPDGGVTIMDPLMVEYLQSTAPEPTQASLDAQLDAATRIRIVEGKMVRDKPVGNKILLDSNDPADLGALRQGLRIVEDPQTFGHCMSLGDLVIALYARKARLAAVGFHHGRSIRWNAWKHDALLADGRDILDWLARSGIPGPKRDFEASQQRARESRTALDR